MISSVRKFLWGNLSDEEFTRLSFLGAIFAFVIGTYWFVRTLKDAVFMKMVGASAIPWAKLLSVVLLIPLVLIYSELVDRLEKEKLFYVLCSVYIVLFGFLAFLLAHPTIGLANTALSTSRITGWFAYLLIETFGSLMPALFWSFVATNTDTSTAKKGYALIIGGAQIGAIAGPSFNYLFASAVGMPKLFVMAMATTCMVPILVWLFVKKYPASALDTGFVKAKKTGPLEGLRLLLARPYLAGILGVATLYEVINTILDFQLKFSANKVYATAEQVAEFVALNGVAANVLAAVFAFIGTSYFIRKFGLTTCLVAFPVTVGVVIISVFSLNAGLWVLFAAVFAIKGLSYALNNPCKEIMYIPTSKDVKYKVKGWIDVFGSRSAKGTGSIVNIIFPVSQIIFCGALFSLGIVALWIPIALYVGRSNKLLVENNETIS